MNHFRIFMIMSFVVFSSLAAAPAAAQDELYLEITQPGLRRVAVAAPPLGETEGARGRAGPGLVRPTWCSPAAAASIATRRLTAPATSRC